jgi:hypothetical protein
MSGAAPAKPASLAPLDPRSTPLAFLVSDARWVGWSWELRRTKDGRQKWTKPPRQPGAGFARNDTAATWASFDAAWQAVQRGTCDGIGLELKGLPQETLAAIDLDDVRDPASGVLLPWAAALVVQSGSYCEITPSGSGLRVIGTAHGLPDTHNKVPHPEGGSFEIYINATRYICVTGHRFGNAPNALHDITAAIQTLLALGRPRPNIGGTATADAYFIPGEDDSADAAAPIDLDTLDPLIAEQISKGTINGVSIQKRGQAFFGVVQELHRAGYGFAAVLATLALHPNGVASKFAGRLETELRRVWTKLGGDRADPGVTDQPWPDPLENAAEIGLAGEFLAHVWQDTEADRAALLFQFLAAIGNAIGPGPHYLYEDDRHPARLNVVLVGDTARGGKGTSANRVFALLRATDPLWEENCVASGIPTGEGIIYAVRDPTLAADGTLTDAGISDKRLLALFHEFASVLRSMERTGSSLSNILREAWDKDRLRTITRTNPLRATGAHVSVIGHITADELTRYLDRTEIANGFANRFMFVCVKRSKFLPHGGARIDWMPLAGRLRNVLSWARTMGLITLDAAAAQLWDQSYPSLKMERPGLLGAVIGRAAPNTARMALIFALLDQSPVIRLQHLQAALACWRYAEQSAAYVFGDTLGDATADTLLTELRQQPGGLNRRQIFDLFRRNISARDLDRALRILHRAGLARSETRPTGGRPATVWKAAHA